MELTGTATRMRSVRTDTALTAIAGIDVLRPSRSIVHRRTEGGDAFLGAPAILAKSHVWPHDPDAR
jgi:hypothetical protein